jgi:uncharacterized protein YjbI with pentapeptide repeats
LESLVVGFKDVDIQELLQRYAGGERDFSNCRLLYVDCDLTGVSLEYAIFVNAELAECDFSGANLRGVNFSGAGLEQSAFNGCNLSAANLSGAFLNQVEFIGADLTGAYLINAHNICYVNFSRANLTNAILRNGMDAREPLIMDNAIFHNTVLPNGSIRNTGAG